MASRVQLLVVVCLALTGASLAKSKVDTGVNLYELISANGNLTQLAGLMVVANLTGLNFTSNTTVFAPTDDALTAALLDFHLSEEDLTGNTSILTALIEYHIVPGINNAPGDFVDGDSFETLEGENVTIAVVNITNSTYHATVVVGYTNATLQGHPIRSKDVTVNLLNGVLVPPSLGHLVPNITMAPPPAPPTNTTTNSTPPATPSGAASVFRGAPWMLVAVLVGVPLLL
jgi:uncharacterized surface protein with fasciclin (FAS1) repeats